MKLNKEVTSYILFGIMTTAVNIITYFLLTKLFFVDYKLAVGISWFLSILFAYITNKLFVFKSRNTTINFVTKEILSFLFYRILSLGIDLALMILLVEWLKTDDFLAKVVVNVIIVVFNYVVSKYLIFLKTRG